MKRYIKSNDFVSLYDELFDKPKDERIRLARDINTAPCILKMLSRDTSADVRRYVAGNPNTPADALNRLADDDDTGVVDRVAGNKNTPLDILEKIAFGTCMMNVDTVARNPSTPTDLLKSMYSHLIKLRNGGNAFEYILSDIRKNHNWKF